MSDNYQPFLGEHSTLREWIKNNKYQIYYLMDASLRHKDWDIRLTFSGKNPYFFFNSVQAWEEFKNLFPDKIDRWDYVKKAAGRVSIGSLDQRKTDSEWKTRRDAIMRTMGINYASKFIPMMIEKFDKVSKNWKEGEWIFFFDEMKAITFEIISSILFGEDIIEKIGLLKYKWTDGSVSDLNLEGYLIKIQDDWNAATRTIHTIMFPFLINYNLTHPHNIIHDNIMQLWKVLQDFLDHSDDKKSVYSQILEAKPEIDKISLMKDMIFFFFAGHDTTSRNLATLMFNLKKNPKYYDTCYNEAIKVLGVTNRGQVKDLIVVEKFDELEHLTWWIKESLRHDNPAVSTLGYQALENVQIWGVPLPKGSKIFLSIHGLHYNLNQWKDPAKFIPDRFNPESDYFFIPSETEKKSRSPYSFIPFSFGSRLCAGKSLATIEAKALSAYMLMKFDFEANEEQIANEYIRFGGHSQFKLKLKITKIY